MTLEANPETDSPAPIAEGVTVEHPTPLMESAPEAGMTIDYEMPPGLDPFTEVVEGLKDLGAKVEILAETPPPAEEPPPALVAPAPKPNYRFTRKFVAQVAHDVNKAYCEAIGDMSQPTWEHAPQWQIDSAKEGVAFHRGHPDAGPSASHDSWMAKKLKDGWIYGAAKDAEKKEHPCMLPFENLPKEQQIKDHLFRAVVHALNETVEPVGEAAAETPSKRWDVNAQRWI